MEKQGREATDLEALRHEIMNNLRGFIFWKFLKINKKSRKSGNLKKNSKLFVMFLFTFYLNWGYFFICKLKSVISEFAYKLGRLNRVRTICRCFKAAWTCPVKWHWVWSSKKLSLWIRLLTMNGSKIAGI